MSPPNKSVSLEEQIDQWRSYLRRRQAIHSVDVAELEDHLREQVMGLVPPPSTSFAPCCLRLYSRLVR